jgi:uncharacterized membrane protein YccC
MDKEDIDKNLELVLYILLGFFSGFYGLIVAGIVAYTIGYKKIVRLLIGFFIGALIGGIITLFLFYSLPFNALIVIAFIVVVIAFAMAHIVNEDRSRIG